MNPVKTTLALLMITLAPLATNAGPRTSASYSITSDTTDTGGTRATSASYSHNASTGSIAGLSSVASPAETVKSGFIAQLTEVTALQLAASPLTINETGTSQLSAVQLLDDATTNNLLATSVSWSVLSGPVTGISADGLATADNVYQDTTASVQGSYGGLTGSLNLTVLDTIKDNFGSYAGDGVGDDWQVQYFGLNNPNAVPNVITDGSGLTNLFKYTAGLIPNNSSSKFLLGNQPVNGQPGRQTISFGPTFADRTYTIQFSTCLGSWSTLTGPAAGNGGTMSFTDTSAGGAQKFYRVQVTKP